MTAAVDSYDDIAKARLQIAELRSHPPHWSHDWVTHSAEGYCPRCFAAFSSDLGRLPCKALFQAHVDTEP